MAAKECPLKLFREEREDGEEWTSHFCSNGEQMCRFVVEIFLSSTKATKTDKITDSVVPMFCLADICSSYVRKICQNVKIHNLKQHVLNLRKKKGELNSGIRK